MWGNGAESRSRKLRLGRRLGPPARAGNVRTVSVKAAVPVATLSGPVDGVARGRPGHCQSGPPGPAPPLALAVSGSGSSGQLPEAGPNKRAVGVKLPTSSGGHAHSM